MATATGLAMSWDEWQRRVALALALGGSGTLRNE
jgi:hypothetical protein